MKLTVVPVLNFDSLNDWMIVSAADSTVLSLLSDDRDVCDRNNVDLLSIAYYFTTIDRVTISCCVTVVVQWVFPENVRGYNLCLFTFFLFSATSPITSTAIPNCFSVDIQYCTCHRGRYTFSFFDTYHNYLGFRQFAKYGE